MPRRITAGIVAAFAVFVSSCSLPDRSVAPVHIDASARRDLLSALVTPLARSSALSSDVVWTFTAGPGGAVSTNSSVGLTITIPAGALASTEQITVTALAGSAVAYSFSPHLTFAQPVSLTQSLSGTNVNLLSVLTLSGAHFSGNSLTLTTGGLALVDELTSSVVNLLAPSVQIGVGHFSGWLIATGRDDSGDAGGDSGQ